MSTHRPHSRVVALVFRALQQAASAGRSDMMSAIRPREAKRYERACEKAAGAAAGYAFAALEIVYEHGKGRLPQ